MLKTMIHKIENGELRRYIMWCKDVAAANGWIAAHNHSNEIVHVIWGD